MTDDAPRTADPLTEEEIAATRRLHANGTHDHEEWSCREDLWLATLDATRAPRSDDALADAARRFVTLHGEKYSCNLRCSPYADMRRAALTPRDTPEEPRPDDPVARANRRPFREEPRPAVHQEGVWGAQAFHPGYRTGVCGACGKPWPCGEEPHA